MYLNLFRCRAKIMGSFFTLILRHTAHIYCTATKLVCWLRQNLTDQSDQFITFCVPPVYSYIPHSSIYIHYTGSLYCWSPWTKNKTHKKIKTCFRLKWKLSLWWKQIHTWGSVWSKCSAQRPQTNPRSPHPCCLSAEREILDTKISNTTNNNH